MTIYADVLFAINFSMDFLSLFITEIVFHKKVHKKRILLSSIIGGLYSVFEILSPVKIIIGAIINVAVSFLMCFVAFKESKIGRFTSMLIMFWAVSASLGGIMSLLYSFLNSLLYEYIKEYSYADAYTGARFFIIVALTIIISVTFTRIYGAKKAIKEAKLTIIFNNNKYEHLGLCDSGNLLTEPLTGRCVILVGSKTTISKEINNTSDLKKRYIPYRGVENDGMLKGVVPTSIFVNDKEVSAVIAPINKESFAGYDALIPTSLI